MTSLTCHKTDKGRSGAHCPPPPSTALRHHHHHYHRQRARASPQQLHHSLSKESLITALWNVTPRRTQLLSRCSSHSSLLRHISFSLSGVTAEHNAANALRKVTVGIIHSPIAHNRNHRQPNYALPLWAVPVFEVSIQYLPNSRGSACSAMVSPRFQWTSWWRFWRKKCQKTHF